ncbi:NAD(P)/FAD-dependent oxidoreductase [Aquimarina sp. W85]|uniref:NAD(P)/FAD-dependent oxidoreductase n=1 Tax=Aquimarina rhodophyticola TaxID=3342246 RepID=UPI003670E1C0
MDISYWEYKNWLSNIDIAIIGSGIVGLQCALQARKRFPKAKIIVFEKGILPEGASTKNAGFACFGSISEIMDDLTFHTKKEIVQLVQKRYTGLQNLRTTLGDKAIDFKQYGGYEVFTNDTSELYENCIKNMSSINEMLYPVFNQSIFSEKTTNFGFQGVQKKLLFNSLEGQIDTGAMMSALLKKVVKSDIKILNGCAVLNFIDNKTSVFVETEKFSFKTDKICIATNGFAKQLGSDKVTPARAQVVITKPIKNLKIKGTFHINKGFYYFRNIQNRILLGGGRNLDFKTENTLSLGHTPVIQNALENLLKTIIAPNYEITIDRRWSGIMGVGDQKKPIVKQLSENVFCGVRLGGMGIAIGSSVGKELADLL